MYLDKLNKQERKDILKRTEYILDTRLLCFAYLYSWRLLLDILLYYDLEQRERVVMLAHSVLILPHTPTNTAERNCS